MGAQPVALDVGRRLLEGQGEAPEERRQTPGGGLVGVAPLPPPGGGQQVAARVPGVADVEGLLADLAAPARPP